MDWLVEVSETNSYVYTQCVPGAFTSTSTLELPVKEETRWLPFLSQHK